MPEQGLRPAVFLDRDGTMIEEVGYLNHPSRFRMFPFVAEALRRFNEAGLCVVVITNQSGVGRGYFPESFVHEVHKKMMDQLSLHHARIDAIYYCPHTPAENCDCRKPKTGMLVKAAADHSLDLKGSFVVGDRYKEIEVALEVGARGILVQTGYGQEELVAQSGKWPWQPDFVARDLSDAAEWILGRLR